jgi:hypothetical protein
MQYKNKIAICVLSLFFSHFANEALADINNYNPNAGGNGNGNGYANSNCNSAHHQGCSSIATAPLPVLGAGYIGFLLAAGGLLLIRRKPQEI